MFYLAKAELGVKRRCLSCEAAFYDLNRSPIVCVKCGVVFHPVEFARLPPRRTWTPMPRAVAPLEPVVAAAEVQEADEADDAGEESTILPTEDEDEDDGLDAIEGVRNVGKDEAV